MGDRPWQAGGLRGPLLASQAMSSEWSNEPRGNDAAKWSVVVVMARFDPATLSEPPQAGTSLDVPVSAPSDEAASFECLFSEEYEPMLRLAFLMVGSREHSEDIVHDSFAQVFERWDRIENPGGYLRTTVVNRSRDVLRRQRLVRRHASDHREQVQPEHEVVLDLLDCLSPRRRAIVVLRYFEQHTIPEISDLLGVREGTVKSALHRSLETIRKEFPNER